MQHADVWRAEVRWAKVQLPKVPQLEVPRAEVSIIKAFQKAIRRLRSFRVQLAEQMVFVDL